VLKISKISKVDETRLQLDGSLTESWADELRLAVEGALSESPAVLLDLQQLRYADPQGVALIRQFMERRVVVVNGSPFIKAQLEMADGI
jgi:ABC-type transporter Mla MlaB component